MESFFEGQRSHCLFTFAASKPAEVPAKTTGRGGLTGFLQEKTGVTGAWTLGVGVAVYALSKELYVINSEVQWNLR